IALAAVYPPLGKKGGILKTEYTISYGIVCLIFFLSGISLKSKVLAKATLDWKIHLITQTISLGITPLVGFGIGKLLLLSPNFDVNLAAGLVVACATPTTISSNVLMTKMCGGNEAAALVNAVIGNIIGVFISPSLIVSYVSSITPTTKYGEFNYRGIFLSLTITVIIPLFVGQIVQFLMPNFISKVQKKLPLAKINSSMLLILVWGVFCDTFSSDIIKTINITSLISIIFLNLFLFLLFSSVSFIISRIKYFHFEKRDSVAIVMCGATKTVALGIPMINIIFGQSSAVGILSIPLLIYHAEQLVIGQGFVHYFDSWIKKDEQVELDEII
ncbi:hypothetical protein HK099_007797, partial [Clydaea vesicula]